MVPEFPLFQWIRTSIIFDSGISLLFLNNRLYSDSIETTKHEELIMNNQTTRLIRLPEVQKRTGFSKAWIYRLISEKRFPTPIKIGLRAVAFVENEIEEWIQSAIEGSKIKVS